MGCRSKLYIASVRDEVVLLKESHGNNVFIENAKMLERDGQDEYAKRLKRMSDSNARKEKLGEKGEAGVNHEQLPTML